MGEIISLFCYFRQVAILLKDVNDRTPEFQFYDYQSEVSEDGVVGTTVTTLLATDMDSAENTVVSPFLGLVSGQKATTKS